MDPLFDKLASAESRFQEIEELMAKPEVSADFEQVQKLAKERASLEGMVTMSRKYRKLTAEKAGAQAILEDGSDQEMLSLARDELAELDSALEQLNTDLRWAIVPKNPNDDRNVIMEIREGVGGQEASLFASDLYRMYTRYAALQNWQVELLNANPSDAGGFKEIILEVRGKGAYSRLKFERGSHRVQRVPATEASGRIHTSTSTVVVMPEADEVDIQISPDVLRIDIYHASGHGGQNVNKVATAVRIVHIPTGTVALCQDERSQFKNKQKAMAILRARLFEAEQRKQDTQITEARRAQVGTGERAEKIRTYNFPQDRITDHRINRSFHGIPDVLAGELDEIINALATNEEAALLEEALA